MSIVPVGLTKFRENLYPLKPFTPELASKTLDEVTLFGDECIRKYGNRIFFCGDELYLKCGRPVPEDEFYEEYYQLENGVGMLRLLETEFFSALSLSDPPGQTQRFSIATGVAAAPLFVKLGSEFTLCNLIVGIVVAVIVALVLFGGIKRIGSVTEKIVPVMAVVYIISTLVVIFANIGHIGQVFGMIFKGAFSAEAALGGAFGITISTSITKGIARGCFSNEAGLGSAPMAHAATSETNPVKQGFFGIIMIFQIQLHLIRVLGRFT